MAAATEAPPAASPTGYETFLSVPEAVERTSSETSLTVSITDGAAAKPQSVITSYFPAKGEEAAATEARDDAQEESTVTTEVAKCDDASDAEVPHLVESGSSDHSASSKAKEGAANWAESVCSLTIPCGKLDVELTQDEDTPESKDGAPSAPSKTWSEAIAEKTHQLMMSLGLAAKKEQALITDFFQPKPAPEKAEKASVSEKVQETQTSAKGMKQTLMTDFIESTSAVEEIPAVPSIATEPGAVTAEEAARALDPSIAVEAEVQKKEKKMWKVWNKFVSKAKGLASKLKLPEKAKAVKVPDMPQCPALPEVAVAKVEELQELAISACSPTNKKQEEADPDKTPW